MERIRLLIVDDHPAFLDGLLRLVELIKEIEVVGQVTNGEQAVEAARNLQPDVILMDLKMPGMNGIEATRQILEASPHIGILILTMFEDDDSVFAAMRVGARGYLLKGADRHEIKRAILAAFSGEAIFSQGIAQKMVRFFTAIQSGTNVRAFPKLSDRELEILNFIAQGESNLSISTRLHLSPKTVRNHVSNIFHKLQVENRAHAIILARDAGLG